MSWSQQWNSRINVTSLVSLGIEQVAKLKEDVEKQFDHLVITDVNSSSPKRDASDHLSAQLTSGLPTGDLPDGEIPHNSALSNDEEEGGEIDDEEKQVASVEAEIENCEDQLDTITDPFPVNEESIHATDPGECNDAEDFEKNEMEGTKDSPLKIDCEGEISMRDPLIKLREEVLTREKQLLMANETTAELHNALDATCHREVLAAEKNQLLVKEIEQLRSEKSKWQRREDEGRQTSQEMERLQQALTSKEAQLQSLLEEGNALSIKQAQTEQRIRRIRREKDEQTEAYIQLQTKFQKADEACIESKARLASLQEEKTTLKATIEQYQRDLTMRSQQIERLEEDMEAARKESQSLQQQNKHLQHTVTSLEEEREIDSKVQRDTDTFEREKTQLEQNLCILKQKCEDLEHETLRRENNARNEIIDLKQKWQKALRQIDCMNATITEATQPFHQQVRALQQEQRACQKAWNLTETKLQQTLEEERKRNEAVQNTHIQLKLKIDALETKNASLQTSLMLEKEALKLAREKLQFERNDQKLHKEAAAGEKLFEVSQQVVSLQEQLRLKQTEYKGTIEQQRMRIESLLMQVKDTQALKEAKIAELALLRSELNQLIGSKSSLSHIADTDKKRNSNNHAEHGQLTRIDSGNSGAYVFDLSHLQQTLRLREGENQLLKQQLCDLKSKQKALTEQLIRLTSENATLQSENQQNEQNFNQKQQIEARYQLLLELFGEKEEEIEELQAKLTQIHNLYEKSKATNDTST